MFYLTVGQKKETALSSQLKMPLFLLSGIILFFSELYCLLFIMWRLLLCDVFVSFIYCLLEKDCLWSWKTNLYTDPKINYKRYLGWFFAKKSSKKFKVRPKCKNRGKNFERLVLLRIKQKEKEFERLPFGIILVWYEKLKRIHV